MKTVRYKIMQRGFNSSRTCATLEEAIEIAGYDCYFGDDGIPADTTYIVKETTEKVWAGSEKEMARPLKVAS